MSLRRWVLLPAWVWAALLSAAPMAAAAAYSLMTRCVYGGLEEPWTAESYERLADPLYGAIRLRSLAMAGAAKVLCIVGEVAA